MELLDWATSHSKTRGQRWSFWTGRRHTARRKGSDGAIGLGDVTQQDERAAMELLDWAMSHSKTRGQCIFVAETVWFAADSQCADAGLDDDDDDDSVSGPLWPSMGIEVLFLIRQDAETVKRSCL